MNVYLFTTPNSLRSGVLLVGAPDEEKAKELAETINVTNDLHSYGDEFEFCKILSNLSCDNHDTQVIFCNSYIK